MEITTTKSVAEREDEGTVVHVQDAEGEPQYYQNGEVQKPVTITVAGSYSSRFRKAEGKLREKNANKRRTKLKAENFQSDQIELVARCIISWEGFTANGQPFQFSKDNAVILLDSAPWIREQVEEAMYDHAGFSKTASVN